MDILKAIYLLIRAFLVPRLSMAAENLALRQQLAVYDLMDRGPELERRRQLAVRRSPPPATLSVRPLHPYDK